MRNKLYYYVVSLVGYETHEQTTLIHTKKYLKQEFNKLVRSIAIRLIINKWYSYRWNYEYITDDIVTILITEYGFIKLEPTCEYVWPEHTFYDWLGKIEDNIEYPDDGFEIRRPEWIPKEIRDKIEAEVVANAFKHNTKC